MTILAPETAASSPAARDLIVPSGLDALSILPHKRRSCEDVVYYVAHRLCTSVRGEDGVALHSEFMARLCGGNGQWSDTRKACLATFAEEVGNGSYVVGKRSKRYRLAAPWIDTPTKRITPRNTRLSGEIKKWESERPTREGWLPVHHHLERSLALLTLDADAVPDAYRGTTHVKNLVERFQASQATMTVPPPGRRVYSVATNMKKELRPYLRLAGEPVAELDVRAAQPLLLGLLCKWDYTGEFPASEQRKFGDWSSPKLHKSRSEGNHPATTRDPSPSLHTMLSPPGSNPAYGYDDCPEIPPDLDAYISECEAGDIYELLATTWNWPRARAGEPLLPHERGEVKGQVFKSLLFGRVPRGESWGVDWERWLYFQRDFPTVAAYIRKMKLAPPADHAVVAHVAQKTEAWIMVEQVCGRLMREHPRIPVVTVHDALIVPRRHTALVREIMREEWGALGLNPTIQAK